MIDVADSPLDLALQEVGVAVLRLKAAIERVNKQLTPLASDKDVDMFVRADIREALLILREAVE